MTVPLVCGACGDDSEMFSAGFASASGTTLSTGPSSEESSSDPATGDPPDDSDAETQGATDDESDSDDAGPENITIGSPTVSSRSSGR